ncbi:MAG: PEP-CTERM/exosortase system-associated acyltransferase [Acidobacteriota bacterium]|jgi:N-acyl amino acid synthase of PEP-CTERM/exosortase system
MIETSMNPFEYKKVSTDDPFINEVYKLRYKVYCEEWGFEKQEDHPGGMEKDQFDEHSVHFVVMRKGDNQVIGTIRMINNSEKGFPVEQHFQIDTDLSAFNKDRFGEISRLAISKDYRKRATDAVIFGGNTINDMAVDNMFGGRRKIGNDIVFGLYKCIYQESVARGHKYLFAVMARGLFLLLKRIGIVFEPIGPTKFYHGLRTPYLGRIDTMLQELIRSNPALYEEFAAGFRQK